MLTANPATRILQTNYSRRKWLLASSATLAALVPMSSTLSLRRLLATDLPPQDQPTKKLLFFTKSGGFEHSVVNRENGQLSYAERLMVELGKKYNIEVTCSKDGRVFDKDYREFDGFFFYTTENLVEVDKPDEPAMTIQGKQNLLDAVMGGKGFIGSHCASDTFHSQGDRKQSQAVPDPYIQMVGGEFIRHGRQQVATMRVVDPAFPGAAKSNGNFKLNEEWYSLKNFAADMHVILVQETAGMVDDDYQRPPYPATWARKHGQGRVFFTSMGHREDVWTNPIFESLLFGGIDWALGRIDVNLTANLSEAAPGAMTMPKLK